MTLRKKQMTPQVALTRLQDLCSRAEHCTHELREKLRRWGITTSDAEKIIAELGRTRYIDDARFANAYARDKFLFAHWGCRKIELQLRLKHISADTIRDALDSAIDPDTYYQTLLHLLTLRGQRRQSVDNEGNKIADLLTYEGRTRMYRFAIGRGFESELVARALRQLHTQTNSD